MHDISTSAINLLPVTLRKRPPGLRSFRLELPSGVAEVRTPEISNKDILPVVIFLHGAGHVDGGAMDVLCRKVSSEKFILLAPSAYRDSWDILRGGWGEDVAALNEQLNWLREHYMIDDNRISMLGFSDGASYALILCVRNPVISCAAALSPGFYLGNAQSSSLFISHAQNDNVLSFSGAQRLRTQLLEEGANVTFMMHDAGHSCPEMVVTIVSSFCLDNAIPPGIINTNVYSRLPINPFYLIFIFISTRESLFTVCLIFKISIFKDSENGTQETCLASFSLTNDIYTLLLGKICFIS